MLLGREFTITERDRKKECCFFQGESAVYLWRLASDKVVLLYVLRMYCAVNAKQWFKVHADFFYIRTERTSTGVVCVSTLLTDC